MKKTTILELRTLYDTDNPEMEYFSDTKTGIAKLIRRTKKIRNFQVWVFDESDFMYLAEITEEFKYDRKEKRR